MSPRRAPRIRSFWPKAVAVAVCGLTAAGVSTPGLAAAPAGWEEAGSMRQPRQEHTATLLSGPDCNGQDRAGYCGQVLVAGGFQAVPVPEGFVDPRKNPEGAGRRPWRTAEVYEPKSRRWRPAGSMTKTRWGHQAVGLLDGRVLVVGGIGGKEYPNRPTAEAELYDPKTKKWRATGSLDVPRWLFTATLLHGSGCDPNCGKVLAVGGNSGPALTTAELFDPMTEKWSSAGSVTALRSNGTATLVSGPKCGSICGQVLVTGGPSKTTELFDPSDGTWAPTGEMVAASTGGSAALLPSGEVLVIGSGANLSPGTAGYTSALNAQLFDPVLGTWASTPPPSVPRLASVLARLGDGGILAVGGNSDSTYSELYYRTARTADSKEVWEPIGNLKLARVSQTQTLLGCRADSPVLVAGGLVSGGTTTPTAELFNYEPRGARERPEGAGPECLALKGADVSGSKVQGDGGSTRGRNVMLGMVLAMVIGAGAFSAYRRSRKQAGE